MKNKYLLVVTLSVLVLLINLPVVKACTEYFSGYWSDPKNLTVYLDSSATSFSSDVVPFCWNYISSKVYIPSVRSGGSPESSDRIRIYAEYFYKDIDVIAVTKNYKKGFLGIPVANWNGNWIFSEIIINTNPSLHNWYNFSSNEKRYVINHEVGHSIGLDHQLSSCSSLALMRNGMRFSPSFTTPRTHDKNTLIAKYGN